MRLSCESSEVGDVSAGTLNGCVAGCESDGDGGFDVETSVYVLLSEGEGALAFLVVEAMVIHKGLDEDKRRESPAMTAPLRLCICTLRKERANGGGNQKSRSKGTTTGLREGRCKRHESD